MDFNKCMEYILASMEDIMVLPWVLKKVLKLEANIILSIKSFGNGIVGGGPVALVFFLQQHFDCQLS